MDEHVKTGLKPARRLGCIYLAAAVFAAVMILGFWSCSGEEHSKNIETISIGVPPLEQNALLYIAEHEDFFPKNGLHVLIKNYDTGVETIEGVLKGEVAIAEASEFPFVRAVFEKQKIRIIACNDKFEHDYILARKDRGITKVSDLKGKRIGVALGTITEFYLGRFLALNGMNIRDVTLVNLKPAQFVKAIAGRDIDAIIAWQPYVRRIRKEVGHVVAWRAQSGQPVFGIMICSDKWLMTHRDTVKRFLTSLHQAENFLIRDPDAARTIVQKRLNYDDSFIERTWPRHKFSLSLDQTLVLAMKDEAQWLISHNLTREKTIPDFSGYIYTEGLKVIKPYAVNIIR